MAEFSYLMLLGILLIILGFLLVIYGITVQYKENMVEKDGVRSRENIRTGGGGIIFIGPIPIVFGSDKRSLIIIMLLAIILMLMSIFFLK